MATTGDFNLAIDIDPPGPGLPDRHASYPELRPRSSIAKKMHLDDAERCILHSDRGSQFRSRKQQRALAGHGMVGSMGKVGSAGDNAAMESFFLSCRTTSSTANAERPATSCASRS